MLEQPRRGVAKAVGRSVKLVQADAASYAFPSQVNGMLATFALTFIPQAKLVIQNGSRALAPFGRWVVLDMAWPRAWPWWFHHLLFFLRPPPYGITEERVRRRPWQT